MKERVLLTVSWATFAWALFACYAVGANVLRDGVDDLERMASNDGFFSLVAISPVVWLVLWIVTGSPRILPWRKPSRTAKEG